MRRFLFSTANFPGYIDWGGLQKTACLLRDQGHKVLWASGPEIAPLLQKADIEFASVPVAFNSSTPGESGPGINPRQRSGRYRTLKHFMDLFMDERQVAASCDAHLRLISTWRPDVVIADPTTLAAALAAEASDTPLAGCGYPGSIFIFPSDPEIAPLVAEFHGRMDRLRKRVGLVEAEHIPDPDFLFVAPALHLVYTTPDWFDLNNRRPSPGVQYVGGSSAPPRTEAPAWIKDLPRTRPLILIGRTTNFKAMPEALKIAFEVIKNVGGYGLIGGSTELRAAFEPLPDYIRWEPWLSYEHLMPHLSAAMHHGGLGTACLAVHHAVPQVIVPEVMDNYTHAESIARSGAGIALFSDINTTTLAQALREVLENPGYRASAARLQAQFASLGGLARAAELLLALAQAGATWASETAAI